MSEITPVLTRTGELLDQIIAAFERKKPSQPETIVEYNDGSIRSFNIVGKLGENSISDRKNAVKVEIGTTVTSIGTWTFSDCSKLTSITIPDTVTSIGDYAFIGCSGLASITVDSNNSVYDSRNNCNAIIKTSDNTLIAGCKNTVIPDGITSIGNDAFRDYSGLTSITIPDGVTSIGDNTFFRCSGLTSVTIPDSVTSIGISAFSGCSNLTSIMIPNGVTSIKNHMISGCSKLTSFTISNNVTSIGSYVFIGCTALSSITSFRTSAPTISTTPFGDSIASYTGRNTYSTGNNVLKVPQGATGYDSSYWRDPLQNASRCGFHIEYL